MADPSVVEGLEQIARLICETKGYDPDWPVGEHKVQWETFTELAKSTAVLWATPPSPEGVGELVEQCRSKSQQLFPERMRDGYSYHATAALLDQAADTILRLSAAPPSVECSRGEI